MEYLDCLYKTYEQKINARTTTQKDFHSWMTFYSVATGAILIAFNTVAEHSKSLSFILIGFGLITSFLWFLSCKGYRHWTDHWIKEIQKFEVEIIKAMKPQGITFETSEKFWVYYNQPETKKINFCKPFDHARISTPKVTLAFSFFTYLGWQTLLIRQIYTLNFPCIFFSPAFIFWSIFALIIINAFFFYLSYGLYSNPVKNADKEEIKKLFENKQ